MYHCLHLCNTSIWKQLTYKWINSVLLHQTIALFYTVEIVDIAEFVSSIDCRWCGAYTKRYCMWITHCTKKAIYVVIHWNAWKTLLHMAALTLTEFTFIQFLPKAKTKVYLHEKVKMVKTWCSLRRWQQRDKFPCVRDHSYHIHQVLHTSWTEQKYTCMKRLKWSPHDAHEEEGIIHETWCL